MMILEQFLFKESYFVTKLSGIFQTHHFMFFHNIIPHFPVIYLQQYSQIHL